MCDGLACSFLSLSVLLLTATAFHLGARVVFAVVFIAVKDALQFCNYFASSTCTPVNRTLATLSWIHIIFHPFVANLLASAFSANPEAYKLPLELCLIFGTTNLFRLPVVQRQGGVVSVPCAEYRGCNQAGGKHPLAYGFEIELPDGAFFIYYLLVFVPAPLIGDYAIVGANAVAMGAGWYLRKRDATIAGIPWCLNAVWMAAWAVATSHGFL